MTPHDERDDDQFRALLGATDRDAPPPDPDLLARLRDRSAEAFAPAASPQTLPLAPRRRMVSFLSRALTAAAALLVFTTGLVYWYNARTSRAEFDTVLRGLDDAESL